MPDRTQNPFTPGFAKIPKELLGRDEVLAALDDALERAALDHYMSRPILLYGPRGMGKTVLLIEAARRAGESFGWPALQVEVSERTPLPDVIAAEAESLRQVIEQAPPGHRFEFDEAILRAQVPGVGAELRVKRKGVAQGPSVPTLKSSLSALASLALDHETGIILTIDEIQAADPGELKDVLSVIQLAEQRDWPMVVVAAGLPTIRDVGRGDTTFSLGYLERAEWHEINLLDRSQTLQALQGPAKAAGRPMTTEAAEILAEACGGYPYAIQLYGQHAWRAATGSRTIGVEAAKTAVPRAERELERGLYEGRWAHTTPREQEYLTAVAQLKEEAALVNGSTVARRMGEEARTVSGLRERLIKKGMLVAFGQELDFAMPGMASYVVRRTSSPAVKPPGPKAPVRKRRAPTL